MKKLFVLMLLSAYWFNAKAQSAFTITEGEPVMVYSLPKTQFCIEIEIEKTTQKTGLYYRYSERYLASTKIITEDKISYRLKTIRVKTLALPDPNRTYSFSPSVSLQTRHLTLNNKGILCGINVPIQLEKEVSQSSEITANEALKSEVLLPLGEEYMMAGSEAKLAEGVAKQIYRIRESRLGLLTADVEKLPADGESFKTMLDGLNSLERDLTELFVGKTSIETQKQTINLIPTAAITNQVLFRLSAFKGIVPADDVSGVPYYINLIPAVVPISTPDPKTKFEKEVLYSLLPASTQLSITDGITTLYTNNFWVSQFGKTIPLPESLFKQQAIKIFMDVETGRLLKIE